MKLSIIIPAYNEGERLSKTLDVYVNYFNTVLKDDYEIIIIPNNCSDNTVELVRGYVDKYNFVRFKEFSEAIGKGGAVIEGFKIAKGDLIGFVDADGSTPPVAFFDLVLSIKNNSGVIASRYIKGAKLGIKQPLSRRISSRGFNFIVRLLFGLRLHDTQCGAKLFTKSAVEYIIPRLGITKWAFDVDLLYILKRGGFVVIEIPTEWNDDLNSRLNLKRASIEMFLSLGRLRLLYSPFKFVVGWYDGFNNWREG